MSAAIKNQKSTLAAKKKASKAQRKRRFEISAQMKALWADPKMREMWIAGFKEAAKRPEVHAHLVANSNDPKTRRKIAKGVRRAYTAKRKEKERKKDEKRK